MDFFAPLRRGGLARSVACGIVLAATAAMAGPADGVLPVEPFAGLGIEGFQGEGSIAAALRSTGDVAPDREGHGQILPGLEFRGLSVQGPSSRDAQSPIAAEVRSRIDRFDVAAGVGAAEQAVAEGPSQWVGRIGLSNDRPGGSERLELRTTFGRRSAGGTLGLELGPRLERRLRRGATLVLDGKAEARAAPAAGGGWWSTPGGATDGSGTLGVAAHAGLLR